MNFRKKYDFSKRIDGQYNIWMLGPDPESEVGHDIPECWRWLLIDVVPNRTMAVQRIRPDF